MSQDTLARTFLRSCMLAVQYCRWFLGKLSRDHLMFILVKPLLWFVMELRLCWCLAMVKPLVARERLEQKCNHNFTQGYDFS